MIDVDQQINAVRRRVGSRVLEAGEARTVTIGQTYGAAIEDVWDACTSAERIARWFLPVTGDLRVGGRYQLQNNAGGKIERCEPPTGFAATWEYGGDVSWIELRLAAEPDGGTRFELEHLAPADDQRWVEYGPAAVGVGWDLGLTGLATHLSSGQAPTAGAGAAWMASAEGRRFMVLSSEGWYEANVAGGADPAAARAIADHATAAYTGSGGQ